VLPWLSSLPKPSARSIDQINAEQVKIHQICWGYSPEVVSLPISSKALKNELALTKFIGKGVDTPKSACNTRITSCGLPYPPRL